MCPTVCPNAHPTTIILHPAPTTLPIKNGLKSSISGLFCDSWQPEQIAAFNLSATSPAGNCRTPNLRRSI
jgi:hypothetical protein